MGAFVLLCDLTTERECLDRLSFGTNAGAAHREHYSRVAVGHTLFLYNLDTGQLRGPYAALTPCQYKIESQAWKKTRRSFPWQVRVDAGATFPKPVSADVSARHMPLSPTSVGVLPPCELTEQKAGDLLAALKRENEGNSGQGTRRARHNDNA